MHGRLPRLIPRDIDLAEWTDGLFTRDAALAEWTAVTAGRLKGGTHYQDWID
jgi:hypothetical protein